MRSQGSLEKEPDDITYSVRPPGLSRSTTSNISIQPPREEEGPASAELVKSSRSSSTRRSLNAKELVNSLGNSDTGNTDWVRWNRSQRRLCAYPSNANYDRIARERDPCVRRQ